MHKPWRFTLTLPVPPFAQVCIITINLKGIFRHLDALLSKYQLRSFGCDAPVGELKRAAKRASAPYVGTPCRQLPSRSISS